MTPVGTQPVAPAPSLRKPRRWLPIAGAAVAIIALGAVARFAFWPSRIPAPGQQEREPVVVLPFEVQGGDASLEPLGIQAADRISAAIEGASLGRVVRYRPEVGGKPYTERSGRRTVAETGAATLVAGVIAQRGAGIEIQATVIRGTDLRTVWTLGPERGLAADPTAALDALQERVLGAVSSYLSPVNEGYNLGIYQPPPSLEVSRLANKAQEHFRASEFADAIPLLKQAFSRDTTWLWVPGAVWIANLNLGGRWQERDSLRAFLEARRERLYPGDALRLDWIRARTGSPEEELKATLAWFAADPALSYQTMNGTLRVRRPAEALRYYALRDTGVIAGRDWQSWDVVAARAYHMLGRFEEELAVASAARTRQPRYEGHWARELSALAAMGRTAAIERTLSESHILETETAPVDLINVAASELFLHGRTDEARGYAQRTLASLQRLPDSVQATTSVTNVRRNALRILGRYSEVVRSYEEEAASAGARGLGSRILGMRYRVLTGDTAGALALADSARDMPLTAFAWNTRGMPIYYGAHILSLLGLKEEAVAMLRQAMNHGVRLGTDEQLEWYWAPIKDYPPFQELVKIR